MSDVNSSRSHAECVGFTQEKDVALAKTQTGRSYIRTEPLDNKDSGSGHSIAKMLSYGWIIWSRECDIQVCSFAPSILMAR